MHISRDEAECELDEFFSMGNVTALIKNELV